MVTSPVRITTDDGARLAVTVVEPAGPPLGLVVAGHAMFVCGRTLRLIARALADRGFLVWALDFRGHGLSQADDPRTDWSYDDIVLSDIPVALRAAEAVGLPVFLLGHSLGGHAGLAALAADPTLRVAGVVALGANVWMPRFAEDAIAHAKSLAIVTAWTALTRAVGYFPVRRLGLGTDDEAASYVRQLARTARSDRWASLDGSIDYLVALSQLRVPVLSVSSRGDTWMCRPEAAQRFMAFVGGPVTHRVVGDGEGEASDIDHMGLVLDRRMEPVWAEVGSWLLAHR